MSIPGSNTDRVQVVKHESPGKGGTEDDSLIPAEINPDEDALSARGLYCQPEGGPVDEDVWIGRDGNDLKLRDIALGTTKTLSQLAAAGADTKQIELCFASNDGTLGLVGASDSYEEKGNFIWPGSSYIGTPASIKVTGILDRTGTGYVKIYDLTNAQQICEGTVTSLSWGIADLGTLSNIPTGEAIWEIHLKKAGNRVELIVGALQIKF